MVLVEKLRHPLIRRLHRPGPGHGADDSPFNTPAAICRTYRVTATAQVLPNICPSQQWLMAHEPHRGVHLQEPGYPLISVRLVRDRRAEPAVCRPGVELLEALRVLGEEDIGMPWGYDRGNITNSHYPLCIHPITEQVRHRTDEDAAGLSDLGGFGEALGVEGRGERVMMFVPLHITGQDAATTKSG